ncbi:MAG: carbohydrate kinase family protein [Hyphomicrobiales bacterium]
MTPRFLCVGDVDVDLMISVSRIPDADDKVGGRRVCQAIGGMAANVAVGLSRLGASARLVASIGDDENGAMAELALMQEGVDKSFLVCLKGEATFMCIVLLTQDGEKSLIRVETAAYLPAPQDIPDDAFDDIEHVHLTFGSEQLARHCIARAKAAGATVSLDIEKADLEGNPFRFVDLIPSIDWLFMNQHTRTFLEQTAGNGVLDTAPCVITTLGSSGSLLVRDGARTVISGHAVQVLDSTGAGDGLVAAFLYGRLTEGRPEAEALHRANAAAAIVVQQYGAQTGLPTVAEIDRFLAG